MMRFNDLTAELSGAPIGEGLFERVRGALSRGYRRAIAARQMHADTAIKSFLSRHSDAQLSELGFSPHEIKAIRRQGEREPRLWF